MTDHMEHQDSRQQLKWFQVRLSFLIVAVAIIGTGIGRLYQARENQRRERAFQEMLINWRPFNHDLPYSYKLLEEMVRRKMTRMEWLPFLRIERSSPSGAAISRVLGDRDLVYGPFGTDFLLDYDQKGRLFGARDLGSNWKTGQPRELPPKVERIRQLLIADRHRMSVKQAYQFGKDNGRQLGIGGEFKHYEIVPKFELHIDERYKDRTGRPYEWSIRISYEFWPDWK